MRKFILSIVCVFACFVAFAKANYEVKYRVGNSNCTTTLYLEAGTESEAKVKLIERGTVSKKEADKIIILSIKKK